MFLLNGSSARPGTATGENNAGRMALNENHYHGSKNDFHFFVLSLQRILNANFSNEAAVRQDLSPEAANDVAYTESSNNTNDIDSEQHADPFSSSSSSSETSNDDMGYELLFQSFFMIAMQLLLITVITKLRRIRRRKMQIRSHTSTSTLSTSLSSTATATATTTTTAYRTVSMRYLICHQFWQWETTWEHVNFLLFYSSCIFVISWVLFRFRAGVRLIGTISVIVESSLPLPQYLRNRNRRDTAGLSLIMVLGWLVGDSLKLGYFMYDQQQQQHANVGADSDGSGGSSSILIFIGGAVYAIALDCAVLLQVLYFFPNKQVTAFYNRVFYKFGFMSLSTHTFNDDRSSCNAYENNDLDINTVAISVEGHSGINAGDHHRERWVADAEHVQ